MSANDAGAKFTKIVDTLLHLYDVSRSPKTKLDYLPNSISFEPTNRCNLRCLHCHHADPNHPCKAKGKSGFMDMGVYTKAIDEIRHWANHITLNAHGEPLLHKNILDMVRYAKQAGLAVSLLTNGTMLRPEVTHALVDAHLDRIVFSFEGSCREVHEKVRYGSNFKKTLSNLLYFMIHNQKYGSPPTFICMSVVDSKYTFEDKEAYKQYFNQLPVNTIFFSEALNFSGTTPMGKEMAVEEKNKTSLEREPACRTPWELMTVCWDGSVSACPIDHTETHIIGDVKTESLEAIWNSGRMQKFRQCHLDGNFDWIEAQGTLCSGCNARLNFPEYNLFDMRNMVVNTIVRQASVYGQQLFELNSNVEKNSHEAENRVAFAEQELHTLSEGHTRRTHVLG